MGYAGYWKNWRPDWGYSSHQRIMSEFWVPGSEKIAFFFIFSFFQWTEVYLSGRSGVLVTSHAGEGNKHEQEHVTLLRLNVVERIARLWVHCSTFNHVVQILTAPVSSLLNFSLFIIFYELLWRKSIFVFIQNHFAPVKFCCIFFRPVKKLLSNSDHSLTITLSKEHFYNQIWIERYQTH